MLVEPMPSSKIGHLWGSDAEFSHPPLTVEALVKGLETNIGCYLLLPTPSSRGSKLLLIDRPIPSYRSTSDTRYTAVYARRGDWSNMLKGPDGSQSLKGCH